MYLGLLWLFRARLSPFQELRFPPLLFANLQPATRVLRITSTNDRFEYPIPLEVV